MHLHSFNECEEHSQCPQHRTPCEQVIRVDGRFVRLAPCNKCANEVALRCAEVNVAYQRGFYREVPKGTPESFLARDVSRCVECRQVNTDDLPALSDEGYCCACRQSFPLSERY